MNAEELEIMECQIRVLEYLVQELTQALSDQTARLNMLESKYTTSSANPDEFSGFTSTNSAVY
jgi:hypothetical protein